ncbi:MAG: hypothetical protein M1429_01160 [Patescibacteria group bacterium]|nr:hypothetical protein [Patescibacteria group bacterium]
MRLGENLSPKKWFGDLTYEKLWGVKRSEKAKPTETSAERKRRLDDERRAREREKRQREREEAIAQRTSRVREYTDLTRSHVQATLDRFLSTARLPHQDSDQVVTILPSDAQIRENISDDFRIRRLPEALQSRATEYVFNIVKQAVDKGQSKLQLARFRFSAAVSDLDSIVRSSAHLNKEVRPRMFRALEKISQPSPLQTPPAPVINQEAFAQQATVDVGCNQTKTELNGLRCKLTWYFVCGLLAALLDLPIVYLSVYPRYEGTSMDIPGLIPLLAMTMTITAIFLAHLVLNKHWWAVPLLIFGSLFIGALRMPDIKEAFSSNLSVAITNTALVSVNVLAIPIMAAVAGICFHKTQEINRDYRKVNRRFKTLSRKRDIFQQTQNLINRVLAEVRNTFEQASRRYREMLETYRSQLQTTINDIYEMIDDKLDKNNIEMEGIFTGIRTQVLSELGTTIESCGRELATLSWLKIKPPGFDGSAGGDGKANKSHDLSAVKQGGNKNV